MHNQCLLTIVENPRISISRGIRNLHLSKSGNFSKFLTVINGIILTIDSILQIVWYMGQGG